MRLLAFAVPLLLACGGPTTPQDPNGIWTGADAGLAVFDWRDGGYWFAKNLHLRNAITSLTYECSSLGSANGRLVYVDPTPLVDTAVTVGAETKLFMFLPEQYVDEQYRALHGSSGLSGLVRLSFDAGLYLEGEDRAVFRWRADFSDDARPLQTEGGELQLERTPTCR